MFAWPKCARKEGLEALLTREKPGPKKGAYRGGKPEVIEALNQALEAGKFANAEQARRWLKKEHEVERPYKTVWGWIKKSGRSAEGAAAQSLQERPISGRAIQKPTRRKV